MYHNRLLSNRLIRFTEHFPVTIVSGARQVGKTTLPQYLLPDHDYVVFDASLDVEGARRDPDSTCCWKKMTLSTPSNSN